MSYVRDPSGIIINNDDSHYQAILASRKARKESEKVQDELASVKDELSAIKELLQQVLNGNKNG